MNKHIGLAIVAAGALGGCAYEAPSPYAYFPVPCASAPATVTPAPSGTVSPTQPPTANSATPAPTTPPPTNTTAAGSGECVAVVPTYSYPAYYPYPGYYPGYYGSPVYGSVFIGGRFR